MDVRLVLFTKQAQVAAMIFTPKSLQQWKPEKDKRRRCQWCASGPVRVPELVQVMVGPMRWYFCDVECAVAWQQRRHKKGWHSYLKMSTADRAKLPIAERYAFLTTNCGCEPDDLCGLHKLEVPVPQDTELPPPGVFSGHCVGTGDHAVLQ